MPTGCGRSPIPSRRRSGAPRRTWPNSSSATSWPSVTSQRAISPSVSLQGLFSWAEDDDTALAGAREWKATLPDHHYTEAIYEPAEIQAGGRNVSDAKFKSMAIIGSNPASHVRKIKTIQQLGATAIVLMNVSGADPHAALQVYGQEVLPELRE